MSWQNSYIVLLALLMTAITTFAYVRPVPLPWCAKTSTILRMAEHTLDEMVIPRDFIPLQNSILVKVKPKAVATSGGLYIPENAQKRPTEGEVIETGPGRFHPGTAKLIDIAVQKGDKVLYGKFDGLEIVYDSAEHQIIRDDDVLLTYSGEEATIDNVQCVKDQVLIRLPSDEENSYSKEIIAKKELGVGQKAGFGVIEKVGPGRTAGNGKSMEVQVKPGDNCRFREYAGTEVMLDGVKFNVVRCYDILSIW